MCDASLEIREKKFLKKNVLFQLWALRQTGPRTTPIKRILHGKKDRIK